MILMIDNFDSFTYNIVQAIAALGAEVVVKRNNEISIAEIEAMEPEAIIISPGPGNPNESGICLEAIRHFATKIPILGVCLGHQSIGAVFGATIGPAKKLMHGKTSQIEHDGKGLFAGLPQNIKVMRYHSLAIIEETLPQEFIITARSEDGEIMGMRHISLPIESVQYHPESIATPTGKKQFSNFLKSINDFHNK